MYYYIFILANKYLTKKGYVYTYAQIHRKNHMIFELRDFKIWQVTTLK